MLQNFDSIPRQCQAQKGNKGQNLKIRKKNLRVQYLRSEQKESIKENNDNIVNIIEAKEREHFKESEK